MSCRQGLTAGLPALPSEQALNEDKQCKVEHCDRQCQI